LIAVNKKVSELVHGDKTGDVSLDAQLKGISKKEYNNRAMYFLEWFTVSTGRLPEWLFMLRQASIKQDESNV